MRVQIIPFGDSELCPSILDGGFGYFSLLAMVPILMLAFSACGFTLTVLRPDLLERVQAAIMVQLQGAPEDLQ
ncbi:MAG: hypothetical protein ACK2U1_19870, partial [Anaerolineales bacterium]